MAISSESSYRERERRGLRWSWWEVGMACVDEMHGGVWGAGGGGLEVVRVDSRDAARGSASSCPMPPPAAGRPRHQLEESGGLSSGRETPSQ